ncbi:heterokaryon incompatibility protein-domain-containing protein [Nemania sp. FL0916]|nr:heterokaryon incompatibility protein-domain-containing protein [Nemania sp. FL0916]
MANQNTLPPLYGKLQGSLIRTVRLLPGAPEDPVRCTLKEVPLTRDNTCLNYEALSYVWGDPKDTVPILVNELQFHITRNLNDALCQFRRIGKGFLETDIWIDAICINQNDLDEKSKQVPRIANIYSMANRVVIWLGRNSAEEEEIFRRGFECRSKLHEIYVREIASTGLSFDDWYYFDTHPELDKVENETSDIWHLMSHRSWFTRIWTVQEFCLAGESSIFYAGAHSMTIGALNLWGRSGQASFYSGRKQTAMMAMFARWRWFQDHMSSSTTYPGAGRSVISSLLELLVQTGCIATSVPHDRIYGLLALAAMAAPAPGNLPSVLQPNYLLSYESVYATYARFIIKWTGDLRILLCGRNDLQGVPSWVPDFRYLGMINTLDKPESLASPHFSRDGNQFIVRGSVIARCIKYVPSWNPTSDGRTEAELDLDAKHYFDTEIISLVQQSAKLRNESFGSAISDFMTSFTSEAGNLVWFFKLQNIEFPVEDFTSDTMPRIKTVMLYGKILLDSGVIIDFVRQDTSVQPGDVIAMLEGSNLPSVLRPKGTVYELVGGCCSSFSRNHNSFIGGTREVERFTLI